MKNNGFIERLERYSVKHKLFRSGEKILVGFSGGADSTALLLALWHLKSKYGYSILAAHVNYNLRGDDSQLDEQFVRKFCFDRNISLVVKSANSSLGSLYILLFLSIHVELMVLAISLSIISPVSCP